MQKFLRTGWIPLLITVLGVAAFIAAWFFPDLQKDLFGQLSSALIPTGATIFLFVLERNHKQRDDDRIKKEEVEKIKILLGCEFENIASRLLRATDLITSGYSSARAEGSAPGLKKELSSINLSPKFLDSWAEKILLLNKPEITSITNLKHGLISFENEVAKIDEASWLALHQTLISIGYCIAYLKECFETIFPDSKIYDEKNELRKSIHILNEKIEMIKNSKDSES